MDVELVAGAAWDDIDEAAVRKYLSARASGVLEQPGMTLAALAVGQGFARRQGEELAPTVAGCVLFGRHPEWVQPAWRVTALRISGRCNHGSDCGSRGYGRAGVACDRTG
jgi:predicted HTH transcriptional regulator